MLQTQMHIVREGLKKRTNTVVQTVNGGGVDLNSKRVSATRFLVPQSAMFL